MHRSTSTQGNGTNELLLYTIPHHFFLTSLLLSSLTRRRFFILSDLLDKPWSQVSYLAPGTCLQFFITHRVQHSHCSSTFIECCWLKLSRFLLVNFYAVKGPYEYALRLEPTKLVSTGTRTTYQATGDTCNQIIPGTYLSIHGMYSVITLLKTCFVRARWSMRCVPDFCVRNCQNGDVVRGVSTGART